MGKQIYAHIKHTQGWTCTKEHKTRRDVVIVGIKTKLKKPVQNELKMHASTI